MFAHSGPRLWLISFAAGFAMLVLPQAAGAATPVCTPFTLMVHIPAGSSHDNPRAPCTPGAEGDEVMVKPATGPLHGSVTPAGALSIDVPSAYTAAPGTAGDTETLTFVAFVGADETEAFTLEIRIDDPDVAPACEDVDLKVQAGRSVDVPLHCEDPDGDSFDTTAGSFAHGTYDAVTGRYTAPAGFDGQDTMTYTATDEWDETSDAATVTITVTKAPDPPVTHSPVTTHPGPQHSAPDLAAPALDLVAPSLLKPRAATRRGIPFTATTSEAGRLVIQLFVGRNTARRYGLAKHPTGRVLVGSLTRDLAAGATAVKVRLSSKARKRLKKAASVQLKMIARISDAAGNVRTKRMRITLARS